MWTYSLGSTLVCFRCYLVQIEVYYNMNLIILVSEYSMETPISSCVVGLHAIYKFTFENYFSLLQFIRA